MAEKKDEKPAAPVKNLGAIIQMVAAVLIIAGTGSGAYLTYVSTLGWNSPQITEDQLARSVASTTEDIKEPFIYTMDKFTVNLGGEPKRTIRIEVNLEMLGKEGFEEVINVENRAKARDSIVRILNEKSFGDLESIQGKLFLKQSIASEVNGLLRQGIVKDIYFSEFVVQ
jgi:flagellar FliL protein